MTKLSYDIYRNNRKVKNVTSYEEAQRIVAELGKGWSFKAIYTPFDPSITPEYLEACKKHREKVAQARALKR